MKLLPLLTIFLLIQSVQASPNFVEVTVLNNTFNPQTRFNVLTDNETSKVCYVYNGSESWHYIKGDVSLFGFSDIKNINTWKSAEGTGHNENLFVIEKALNISEVEKVNIFLYDLNGDKTEVTRYNVTTYTEKPSDFINPLACLYLSILFILYLAIRVNVRRIKGCLK
jgi:hypothetical protein